MNLYLFDLLAFFHKKSGNEPVLFIKNRGLFAGDTPRNPATHQHGKLNLWLLFKNAFDLFELNHKMRRP